MKKLWKIEGRLVEIVKVNKIRPYTEFVIVITFMSVTKFDIWIENKYT